MDASGEPAHGKRARSAVAGDDLDYGFATKLLQQFLPALRSPRKDSPLSISDRTELLVQQWLKDAFGKDAPKMEAFGSATKQQKYSVKKEFGEVWTLVETLMSKAEPEERDAVRDAVRMLSTAEGRTQLVEAYGARRESVGDGIAASVCEEHEAESTVAASVVAKMPKGTSVRLVGLTSATHLNGMRGKVMGFADDVQRYIVRLECGTTRRAPPFNVVKHQLDSILECAPQQPLSRSHYTILLYHLVCIYSTLSSKTALHFSKISFRTHLLCSVSPTRDITQPCTPTAV